MSDFPKQLVKSFTVRAYEPGPDGELPIFRLLDYFQEVAALHADTLEISYTQMIESGLGWALARLYVEVEALPRMQEEVVFTTWHSGLEKRFSKRCFQVHRSTGEFLARGTTNWVLFDAKARAMIAVPEWVSKVFHDTHPQVVAFPTRNVAKLPEAQVARPVTARYEDQDANGHVNTSRLAAWVFEPLAGGHNPGRLSAMDIAFRAEAHAEDEIVSDCGRQKDSTWLHALRRLSDGKELVRARTWWK